MTTSTLSAVYSDEDDDQITGVPSKEALRGVLGILGAALDTEGTKVELTATVTRADGETVVLTLSEEDA